MKKLIINIFIFILIIMIATSCNKNNKEKKSNEKEIDLSILYREPIIYKASEKSWNDFEWLTKIPEYPEPQKLDYIEYQEGDYINLYYKNANYDIVRKWADSLLELGFYENKLDEKSEEGNYIAIKRRSLELDLRANPYYYYDDKYLWIFINRTEYQREFQDAEYALEQQKNKK